MGYTKEKKIYNIKRDNVRVIDEDYTEQYRKMLVIEKVSQTYLMEQIKINFHNKLLVKEVRKEIAESNNLISILRKLIKGIDTEFACRVLGDVGTVDDLPHLHAKLNNPDIHNTVKNAMERIQERTN